VLIETYKEIPPIQGDFSQSPVYRRCDFAAVLTIVLPFGTREVVVESTAASSLISASPSSLNTREDVSIEDNALSVS